MEKHGMQVHISDVRKCPLCHSWIALTFQTTGYRVLVGSSMIYYHTTCKLLDTLPSGRYMLLLACSDTPERTHEATRASLSSLPQSPNIHYVPGKHQKWAFEPRHRVVQPESGRRPAAPSAPPGWEPSLGSGVCRAGRPAVSATEDGSLGQKQTRGTPMNSLQTFFIFTLMARANLHIYLKNTINGSWY